MDEDEYIVLEIANAYNVTLRELQYDVDEAISKGLSGKLAFTPETVQALIDYIKNNIA